MRYPASENLEITRMVEASHLPTRQTLRMLGIPSSTNFDWHARWHDGGRAAIVAQVAFAAMQEGHLFAPVPLLQRAVLALAIVSVFSSDLWAEVVGVVVIAALLLANRRSRVMGSHDTRLATGPDAGYGAA